MPSEMTMHERLREYARNTHYTLNGAPLTAKSYNIPESDLAAIERDIRAEAQAPWRDAVNQWRRECHALRAENAALRKAGNALRDDTKAFVDAATAFCEAIGDMNDRQISDKLGRQVSGIALAANAVKAGWSVDAYDAADRAGETPTPKQIEALDALADDAIRAHHAGETVNTRDITPSPTDAAAEGEPDPSTTPWDQQWAKHTADALTQHDRILDDVLDRMQSYESMVNGLINGDEDRLQRAEHRIADLERWRDVIAKAQLYMDRTAAERFVALEQRLSALRGPEVTRPTPEDLQGDAEWPPEHRDAAILNYLYKTTRGDSWPYLSKASLNVILGAVRNWEHEHSEGVTDEMILAYWEASSNGNNRIHPESPIGLKVRAGLEAVFALRAGKGK